MRAFGGSGAMLAFSQHTGLEVDIHLPLPRGRMGEVRWFAQGQTARERQRQI